MVHARARLAEIGEADPELQQRRKLARLKAARRDADLVDRAPEPIAGMRVVVAEVGRPLAGGGADEDEAQAGLELVGEFVHVGQGPVGLLADLSAVARRPNADPAVFAATKMAD